MISLNTQHLIEIFQGLSSRDLNKSLSMDLQDGRFRVDRGTVPGSKSLSERKFISADQKLTAAGEQNVFVRMQVANALQSLAGGARTTDEQRAFLQGALRELLGMDGTQGEVSVQTACKPLEMRSVKQLLAKAERLFALSSLQGGAMRVAATAADLTAQLNTTAALNGKAKIAAKLVGNLERDLAMLGATLAKAGTEVERAAVTRDIERTLRAFNAGARMALSRMTSVEEVARGVLEQYAAKGGEKLGDVAQMRFIGFFARTQLEAGMNVKALRAKLQTALPGFLDGLRTRPQASCSQFADSGVRLSIFTQAEQEMKTRLDEDLQLQRDGRRLTTSKRFALDAACFAPDFFLRGAPGVGEDYHDVVSDYREKMAPRTDVRDVAIALRGGTAHVGVRSAGEGASKAGQISGLVLELCAGNRLQAAGVLAALNQRVDVLAGIFAREAGIDGFTEGSLYDVSRDASGAVVVRISTTPESSMECSVTLRIAADGSRSVSAFDGVKTSDAYAERTELAARAARLTAELPSLGQTVETAHRQIQEMATARTARNLIGEEGVRTLVEGADAALRGLLDTLRDLAANGRPDKEDFGDYLRTFNQSVRDVVKLSAARLNASVELDVSVRGAGQRIAETLGELAGACRTAGNEAFAARLEAFSAKIDAYFRQMQGDFFLSGEVSPQAVGDVAQTMKSFASRIVEQVRELPKNPTTPADVAKYARLLSVELPRPSFTTFSQAAREALLARRDLVSSVVVGARAAENPSFAPVAESVNAFAASVNDLLEQAKDWERPEDRQAFREFVHAKMDALTRAVVEAENVGVAFGADGIGALLRDSYDIIAGAFREHEAEARTADMRETLAAVHSRIEGALEGAAQLSAAQRTALEGARTRLAEFEALLDRPGTLPTHESVKTLAFQLRQEVERFVGEVLDQSVAAKAKGFLSGFKGFFKEQEPARLYPFNPPAATLAEDVRSTSNPFDDRGIGSLEQLNRLAGATRAVTAAVRANPGLFDRALAAFEGLEGAAQFMDVDEDGNVRGFKEVDGRSEGRELVEAAFHDVVQGRIAVLAEQAGPEGVLVDVDALATPEWKEGLLAEVKERLVSTLADYRRVDAEEVQPAQGLYRPGEVHVRGGNAFGLDVNTLSPRQIANLKTLLLATLLDSQSDAYTNLQREIDQMPDGPEKTERRARADAILDQWIREAKPVKISTDDPLAPKPDVSQLAGKLDNKLEGAIRDAILTGRFSLDVDVSLTTCRTIVKMMELTSFAEAGGARGRYTSGFGTTDPAGVFNAFRLNGLTSDVIDRLCAPVEAGGGGFDLNSLPDMLELAYLVNQNSVNGIDSLAVRLFGKPLAELTHADYRAYNSTVHIDGAFYRLDPLFGLGGAERKAADFFLRTGLPSTEHVSETRAIYAEICTMEQRRQQVLEADLTYAGKAVKLRSDGHGHLSMIMSGLVVGDVQRDVTFLCPLDLSSFRRQIEDEMSLNVKAYGADAVLALLPEDGVDVAAARQLALNVISGTTGTLATELCNVTTTDVVEIARALLVKMDGGAVDAKAFLAEALARLDGGGVVCFNGEATLESYQRMEAIDPNQRDEMVTLPEQVRRRAGESVAQARLRQVHAFVAELVMPNDTTKYDLDRRRGASESDILRGTLLAHRYELGVVLRTLGGPDDVLDTFSMAAGDAPQGGEPPRMTEMSVALKARMGQLKDLVGRAGGLDAFFRALERGEDAGGIGAFLAGFSGDIEKAGDSMLGKMQRLLTDKLASAFRQSMEAKNKPLWKQTLDEIAGAGTLDVDSGYGQFLMESLATYFTEMEPIDRHRMSSALFRYADSSSNSGELLGALIKGAGPVLQKLMQGLPQTALPEDLRQAVADLKSRLPSIAPEMVRATLLDMVAQSNGRITGIELVRSFGAATVGQTFLCRVHTVDNRAGEECVLKLLRPDVQNRARRERALFLKLAAKNPTMKEALRTRLESIFEELDFTVEANNVKQGAVYNSGVVKDGIAGIRSMELFPYLGASANVMVLRKAPGTTYDRYVEETTGRVDDLLGSLPQERRPDGTVSYRADGILGYVDAKMQLQKTYGSLLDRQRRLSGFIQKWTYEAFFGDGFFHGDLHSGNIMCDDDLLTVIDYGNAQRLSKSEMKNLKWAFAWIPARDVDQFLSYYREILSPEGRRQLDAHRREIVAALTNVFERGDVSDTGKIMSAIFQIIQQNGVELPGAIFCILQSMQRLDESMRLMNEQLARVEDAFRNLTLRTGDDAVDLDDGPSFLKNVRRHFADAKLSMYGMYALRKKFGPDASLEEMQARRGEIEDSNQRSALDFLMFFGHEPSFEEVFARLPELPENLRAYVVRGGLTVTLGNLVGCAIGREVSDDGVQGACAVVDALALVARIGGGDADDAARARVQLRASVQEIADFANQMLLVGDKIVGLGVDPVLVAVERLFEELDGAEAPNVDELNARVKALYSRLQALVASSIVNRLVSTIEAEYGNSDDQEEVFAGYDDPSTPFGEALQRGSKAFLAELVPSDKGKLAMIGGGIRVLASGGLTLRSKLRGVTEESYRLNHRESHFRTTPPWSTFQDDKGIFRLEAKIVQDSISNFCFRSEVLRDLQKGDWVRDERAVARVKEALRFNLDALMDALRAKGFGDDRKRTSLIQFAMMRLAVARPEWFRSLRGVASETLAARVGADADLRTAFECLRGIANANPPVNDALTDDDVEEIDDMFSLT